MLKITLILTLFLGTVFGTTFNVSTTAEFRQALTDSASNGEADTIILADGTYKTTDDGGGTFKFLDNEDYNLTLKGSSSANVILSGDHQHQIFNHRSTLDTSLILENLSFIDGNNTSTPGGAVYTNENIVVLDCNFTNNHIFSDGTSSQIGGGFFSYKGAIVKNSFFNRNFGGGFSASLFSGIPSIVIVKNSLFNANIIALNSGAGGFRSNATDIIVSDSNFTNNIGTGFESGHNTQGLNVSVSVDNSRFSYNEGGGFIAYSTHANRTIVNNSTFNDNNSSDSGAGFYTSSTTTVNNCKFINNRAESFDQTSGGGFYSGHASIVKNSIFINNSVTGNGGGFHSPSTTVSNSIFTANNAIGHGNGFNSYHSIIVSNSIFTQNSGIQISGKDSIIINNIFLNNSGNDINGSSSTIIATLKNNYLDLNNVHVDKFASDNIFAGVTLGFVDEANADYHLTASSSLIDAGTSSVSGITYPTTDMDGNSRISGAAVDIGPYELPLTQPTIHNLIYTGTPNQFQLLTFSLDYNLSTGRTLQELVYNFEGSYDINNSHIYDEAGTYTVEAKVTDNTGEFSTTFVTIVVVPILYENMTFEQKINYLIDPQYLSDIQQEIVSKTSSAFSDGNVTGYSSGFSIGFSDGNNSGYDSGIDEGWEGAKAYCKANPEECDINGTIRTVIVPMF